jgi:H+/gluconate symporter-like permease
MRGPERINAAATGTWTLMECIISVVGLGGVLIFDIFV